MQFQIEVIKVSPEVNKGKYKTLEVAYKKDGKVEGKPFFDFKYPEVYKVLKNASEGQAFTIDSNKEAGKDGKEYWQWTAIAASDGTVSSGSTGGGAGVVQGASGESSKANTTVGRVTGSNYETAEERKIKQRYIVRQSSISAALDLMKHNSPKSVLDIDAVLSIAKRFESHVFREVNQPSVMADLDDDLPI